MSLVIVDMSWYECLSHVVQLQEIQESPTLWLVSHGSEEDQDVTSQKYIASFFQQHHK